MASDWLGAFDQELDITPVPLDREMDIMDAGKEMPVIGLEGIDLAGAFQTVSDAVVSDVVSDDEISGLFDDDMAGVVPGTGWLADVQEMEGAEPQTASDWLSTFGQTAPITPLPGEEEAEEAPDWLQGIGPVAQDISESEMSGLFDEGAAAIAETGWPAPEEGEATPLAEAAEFAGQAEETPAWLSGYEEPLAEAAGGAAEPLAWEREAVEPAFDEEEATGPAPAPDDLDAFLASITSPVPPTSMEEEHPPVGEAFAMRGDLLDTSKKVDTQQARAAEAELSFSFDREPPWLRKAKSAPKSEARPPDEDNDLPPDWFQ
jgi:hypothetical protein